MPNICRNNFKFVANKETIDKIEKSNFSFSYFFPLPENASTNWYIDNTYTDKDAFEINLNREDDDIIYITCSTAWTVPINFLKNLIKLFPDLYIFNQYCIEFTDCGIVILYFNDNMIKEKQFTWIDPICKEYIKGVYD